MGDRKGGTPVHVVTDAQTREVLKAFSNLRAAEKWMRERPGRVLRVTEVALATAAGPGPDWYTWTCWTHLGEVVEWGGHLEGQYATTNHRDMQARWSITTTERASTLAQARSRARKAHRIKLAEGGKHGR